MGAFARWFERVQQQNSTADDLDFVISCSSDDDEQASLFRGHPLNPLNRLFRGRLQIYLGQIRDTKKNSFIDCLQLGTQLFQCLKLLGMQNPFQGEVC